jgi:hypothetical protein
MTGEHLDYPVDESSSCGIYLHPDLARLHESYFGTGEQTGENYGHKCDYYSRDKLEIHCLVFIIALL